LPGYVPFRGKGGSGPGQRMSQGYTDQHGGDVEKAGEKGPPAGLPGTAPPRRGAYRRKCRFRRPA
jgi:hypothetical protein